MHAQLARVLHDEECQAAGGAYLPQALSPVGHPPAEAASRLAPGEEPMDEEELIRAAMTALSRRVKNGDARGSTEAEKQHHHAGGL